MKALRAKLYKILRQKEKEAYIPTTDREINFVPSNFVGPNRGIIFYIKDAVKEIKISRGKSPEIEKNWSIV